MNKLITKSIIGVFAITTLILHSCSVRVAATHPTPKKKIKRHVVHHNHHHPHRHHRNHVVVVRR
jgi:hypothetical protein